MTRNRMVLNQGEGRKVTQTVYFRGSSMEIVTRDAFGTEIRSFHNFGSNLNGLGTTRIIKRGRPKALTP